MFPSFLDNWAQFPDVSPNDIGPVLSFPEKIESVVDGIDLLFDSQKRLFALSYFGNRSAETISHALIDLVFPRLLAYDGHLVLHCGLVNSPNGALGFIGESGTGKSTLTASLHNQGYPLMGDDAGVLRQVHGTCYAERLSPSLRLFPDSIGQLFPSAGSTSPVADYTDKQHVPFERGPDVAPLAAVFRLADPSKSIRVARLSQAEACIALIANSFALDPTEKNEASRRLSKAVDVARRVPIFDLYYPRDYAAIPDVHTKIFETVELTNMRDNSA